MAVAVGLVIVSHSARLAEGIVELAEQMAHGSARIIAAGGAADGSLGTSLDKVQQAVQSADSGDGVLVLMDLGSAAMVAEMCVEQLPAEQRARVVLSNAPVVEGAVLAAVEASIGSPLAAVAETAQGAVGMSKLQEGR
jgi:phosphoenolpyruvate---glycerone phosphotransferase subunit DhaM